MPVDEEDSRDASLHCVENATQVLLVVDNVVNNAVNLYRRRYNQHEDNNEIIDFESDRDFAAIDRTPDDV
jgi:hypothetical protein